MSTVCPDCGNEIQVPGDCFEGEIFECENCGLEVQVVELNPLRVQPFEEEEK